MKISHTEKIITPKLGTRLAGYGTNDVSYAKLDDLYLSALMLDNGQRKAVILGYDLLGIEDYAIKQIRKEVAALFGGAPSDVILSCTHTHSGPNTRIHPDRPEIFEKEYLQELIQITVAAVREILDKAPIDTHMFFFSRNCDENVNRRYVGPNNRCSFLPHRRDMERIADGVCDKELGGLCFFKKETGELEYVIGNYAAHPLAGHALGISAHRISADFPGQFRSYIKNETGAGCMYLTGAAGDMVPRGHETGAEAIRRVGTNLAMAALDAIILSKRDPNSYKLVNETLESTIETRTYRVRPNRRGSISADYNGEGPAMLSDQAEVDLEVQLLSIGDVCLVGVPGEMVAELGLEIKWHSPFRKTFILYDSTSYISYVCHGNALVSGGYEATSQNIDSRSGLQVVNAAVDGAYTLYERTYPDVSEWPQNKPAALVAMKNIDPFE